MNDTSGPKSMTISTRSMFAGLVPLAIAGLGLAWLQMRQPAPNTVATSASAPNRLEAEAPTEVAAAWRLQIPEMPESNFVGSEACRACHAQIVEQYSRTGMGRSFTNVSDDVDLVSARPEFDAAGRRYRVIAGSKETVHIEEFVDDTGALVCQQAVNIQYSMGSGSKGKSYLFEHAGALFMSPISWYAEGNRFDLSPGYQPNRGDRFERRITSRCLSCHVGQVNPIPGELDRFASPPFGELAIGCERCHGPGEAHVRYHSGEAATGDDPIVNLSRLPVEQREAVCNQCHLLGAEEILRAGRSDFDFRPGMRLSDVWTLFLEPGLYREEGTPRAVSQVEQMRDSRCYRRSRGEMGCTTCHDPHSQPTPERRDEFYRGKCQACHSDQGCTAGPELRAERSDSCISCHMPAQTDHDIPHVSQSDHSIPRVPMGRISANGEKGRMAGLVRRQPQLYYDGQSLPEVDLQRARGIVAAKRAEQAVDEQQLVAAIRLLERVAAANPDDIASTAAIARCYSVLGKPADAAPLWGEILLRDRGNEEALLSMAQMHHRVGQFAEALPFIESFLEKNDWPSHAHGLRAQVRERMGALPDALRSAQIALERDPTRVSAYRWLEDACTKLGDIQQAAKYRSTRERLEQLLFQREAREEQSTGREERFDREDDGPDDRKPNTSSGQQPPQEEPR